MTISDYLDKQNIAPKAFATRLGKSASWVGKVMRGARHPSRLMMGVIERVTGGAVPFEAWRPTDDQIDTYLSEISPNRPLEMGPDHAPASQAGERAA